MAMRTTGMVEASQVRCDVAYAVRQLAEFGCIDRALDALERVLEACDVADDVALTDGILDDSIHGDCPECGLAVHVCVCGVDEDVARGDWPAWDQSALPVTTWTVR